MLNLDIEQEIIKAGFQENLYVTISEQELEGDLERIIQKKILEKFIGGGRCSNKILDAISNAPESKIWR